jgi:hypothetical protein
MAATLESYQNDLIEISMSVNALKFGTFTLKSGRYELFSLQDHI